MIPVQPVDQRKVDALVIKELRDLGIRTLVTSRVGFVARVAPVVHVGDALTNEQARHPCMPRLVMLSTGQVRAPSREPQRGPSRPELRPDIRWLQHRVQQPYGLRSEPRSVGMRSLVDSLAGASANVVGRPVPDGAPPYPAGGRGPQCRCHLLSICSYVKQSWALCRVLASGFDPAGGNGSHQQIFTASRTGRNTPDFGMRTATRSPARRQGRLPSSLLY
jgi:hypothetical protein